MAGNVHFFLKLITGIIYLFLVGLEFELRASHLQSRCSTTRATTPVHCMLWLFWRWESHQVFAQAGDPPSQSPK
jgi:hypothetical protein